MTAAIAFDKVSFTYDGNTYVLDDISLSVERGEFICILGGNGSGKSTLAKLINALLTPDRGSVHVLGLDTRNEDNTYTIRSNAGMVFQNPDDQLVASLIEDDVAFGPENLGVPTPELRERVADALDQVGLRGFERVETTALSGGQKQRVAIAGALAMQPQILILDEASAMLDPRGRTDLMRLVHTLNAGGMTIIMITHVMEEAAQADRVLVLDAGRIALQGTPADIFARADELAHLSLDIPFATKMSHALAGFNLPITPCVSDDELVLAIAPLCATGAPAHTPYAGEVPHSGQDAEMLPPDQDTDQDTLPADSDIDCIVSPYANRTPVIEFCDAGFSYHARDVKRGRKRKTSAAPPPQAAWGNDPAEPWAIKDITFSLHEGEFLGIAGHTGSGKSTLIQHMNGLLLPTQGRVLAYGEDLADKDAAVRARGNVGMVFQYPEHQLFAATVFEDVAFGPRNLGLSPAEVEERYVAAMDLVSLDAVALRNASPFELSGGQQRRVAFAGVLAMGPKTLILDEPVAGLDPRAREDFLQFINRVHRAEGMTVVMVTHDMDDLARFCDRILVLDKGRLFAVGTPDTVFADADRCKSVGLGLPSAQSLANKLIAAGVPLPQRTCLHTLETLAYDIVDAVDPTVLAEGAVLG